MDKLKVNEIVFGKIDAYNELQNMGEELYLDAFLPYEKYKIQEFLDGDRFYICGSKGTGKTALLKYLECSFSKDTQNLVIPVRFKSQFDDEDKRAMRATALNVKENVIDDVPNERIASYVNAWLVYIISLIFKYEKEGEYDVFERTYELELMKQLLDGIYSMQDGRVVPKLTKGYAAFAISSTKGLTAEIKAEIEFDEKSGKVNYAKTAKMICSLFSNLQNGRTPVRVLFDELELSVRSRKDRTRDIELIRDLIIAIDRFNKISKERQYDVLVIASIRTDVINNALMGGYEINKCIEDYGVIVGWFQKGGDYKDSPLLKIIECKIRASEKKNGIISDDDIWEKYFEEKANNVEIRKYILSYTWQRPRDIIRMMNIIVDQYEGEEKINQEMIDRAMQLYSERTWNEIAEELTMLYVNSDDISAIRKILNRIDVPFTYQYLKERAESLSKLYECVANFFERNKLQVLVEKLFELGVIGNSGARMVFKFLGDDEVSLLDDMIIHKPLRNYFAVQSREKVSKEKMLKNKRNYGTLKNNNG